jgi:hypothetical protein
MSLQTSLAALVMQSKEAKQRSTFANAIISLSANGRYLAVSPARLYITFLIDIGRMTLPRFAEHVK